LYNKARGVLPTENWSFLESVNHIFNNCFNELKKHK
jgi:hypothetical protein